MAENIASNKLTILHGDSTGLVLLATFKWSMQPSCTLQDLAGRLQRKTEFKAEQMEFYCMDGTSLDHAAEPLLIDKIAETWKIVMIITAPSSAPTQFELAQELCSILETASSQRRASIAPAPKKLKKSADADLNLDADAEDDDDDASSHI